jgi:hypothetical protein
MSPLQARDRRARRALTKKVGDGSLANKRIIVGVCSVFEAMLDPHIMLSVGELLALSAAAAVGASSVRRRECFVCCRSWAPTIVPAGVVVMEIIGMNDTMLALICQDCFTDGVNQAVIAALQRDLGAPREPVRFIHDAAPEQQ